MDGHFTLKRAKVSFVYHENFTWGCIWTVTRIQCKHRWAHTHTYPFHTRYTYKKHLVSFLHYYYVHFLTWRRRKKGAERRKRSKEQTRFHWARNIQRPYITYNPHSHHCWCSPIIPSWFSWCEYRCTHTRLQHVGISWMKLFQFSLVSCTTMYAISWIYSPLCELTYWRP